MDSIVVISFIYVVFKRVFYLYLNCYLCTYLVIISCLASNTFYIW